MSIAALPEPSAAEPMDSPEIRMQLDPARPMTQDEYFDFCQIDRKIRYERTSQCELVVNSWLGGMAGFQASAIGSQTCGWAKDKAGGIDLGTSSAGARQADERRRRPGVARLRARPGAGVAGLIFARGKLQVARAK